MNLSDRDDGWEKNCREPDVAAFLKDGKAINHDTHWQGAADSLVEIINPGERTHDKITFYGRIGVVELLVIDRDPWTIELFRQKDDGMEKVGQTTLDAPETLECRSVGLTFQLLPGKQRPMIKAVHPQSGRQWEF